MTDIELGWIAGFVDGEGCIRLGIDSRKNNITINFSVSGTNKESLNYIMKLLKCGNITAKITKEKNRKAQWNWTISGIKAVESIKIIEPHLIVKKQQAILILEYYEKCVIGTKSGRRISEEMQILRHIYYKQMLTLNKTGAIEISNIKSGYRGVMWDSQKNSWRSVFSDPWEHLGYFHFEIQAAFCYDIRAKKAGYGPELLNFPHGLDAEGRPL